MTEPSIQTRIDAVAEVLSRTRVSSTTLLAVEEAAELLNAARMTKTKQRKMQREAEKRGDKYGKKIWVEVTQQPEKNARSGQYIGRATFHWQKGPDKDKKHSVNINVGKEKAKLTVKSRQLQVKPKDGEPYMYGEGAEDEERGMPESGETPAPALNEDMAKRYLDSVQKMPETADQGVLDSLGKKLKTGGSEELKKLYEDVVKKVSNPSGVSEADMAKSAMVKTLESLIEKGDPYAKEAVGDVVSELDKRLGPGSKLAKDLADKVAKMGAAPKKKGKAPSLTELEGVSENALKSVKTMKKYLSQSKKAPGAADDGMLDMLEEKTNLLEDNFGETRESKALRKALKEVRYLRLDEKGMRETDEVKGLMKSLDEGLDQERNAVSKLLEIKKRYGGDSKLAKEMQTKIDNARMQELGKRHEAAKEQESAVLEGASDAEKQRIAQVKEVLPEGVAFVKVETRSSKGMYGEDSVWGRDGIEAEVSLPPEILEEAVKKGNAAVKKGKSGTDAVHAFLEKALNLKKQRVSLSTMVNGPYSSQDDLYKLISQGQGKAKAADLDLNSNRIELRFL